jgi:hypothetical protein
MPPGDRASAGGSGPLVNGWDFWHVPFEGETVKLAVVRDRYRAERLILRAAR